MPKKRTLSIGGMVMEAEEVDFQVIEEPWGTYELETGERLRVRLAVSRIFRLPQPDPQTGEAAYYVVGTTINRPL